MYYEDTDALPQNIREALPIQAQEVYQTAFNNAYEEEENEQRAHEIAYAAVNSRFGEDAREWHRKMDQSAKDSTPVEWDPD